MRDFPFAYVGFDLDGTLVDTADDLLAATNHALASADIAPLSNAQIRTVIGGGARMMLQLGIKLAGAPAVSDERLDSLLITLLAHYEANIAVHSRPFEGTLAALDALDAMGVRYAVVTNKREHYARLLLDALGLTHRLATIIGGDTLAVAKPDPITVQTMIARCGGDPVKDAARTAFIGDSHFDIDAGRAAGTTTVACSFGYMMQPVETLNADAVINHFDELVPRLRRLG
ncbi:HAD hydrolase-like protein [Sphingomonas lacunae]|uniref:phosphoglycolate phosphatase n=1 Tax=Sphingomonas lacunae TaxID=2698828 RepID=A0A6M4AWS2_9SPHN|nr:HAD hydrolase-like protein [Sphingomonas lacunae]QJQ32499.1 HAD hydrolase-like protein [Sphingomonas lacunae]